MSWFADYFKTDEREEKDARAELVEQASAILAFADLPYFRSYCDWLDQQANRPLPVGDHMEMVKVAVRSNTLREIRQHLLSEVAAAKRALAAERESRGRA